MPSGFYWDLLLLVPLLGGYSRLGARGQNALLLATAAALLASWDPRFPLFLAVTTLIDYGIGRQLAWERPDAQRLAWLLIGVAFDVGMLAAFRYLPSTINRAPVPPFLLLVAPVGVSFYTLARLTHTLDAYYKLERPCADWFAFLTFTSFFPLLISGPIERAGKLLPVLARRREVTLAGIYEGTWLILSGVFQKVFIADRCAVLCQKFAPIHAGSWLTALGVVAYSFQIFCDFSGYSDVARGIARLFGVHVTKNFVAPYASLNLAEYWQRWHVSLSSWLDDYIYKPSSMALRDFGTGGIVAAAFLTFFVSALWHGRGLTFLCWGALHATGLSVLVATRKLRKQLRKSLPDAIWRATARGLTFGFVCAGLVFFRAPSLSAALSTFAELGHPLHALVPDSYDLLELSCLGLGVWAIHALQNQPNESAWFFERPVWVRGLCYAAMLFCIARLPGETQRFIYAQF